MHRRIRSVCGRVPVLRTCYGFARSQRAALTDVLTARAARRYFLDYAAYYDALHREGRGTVDIRTADGLKITIRRNLWDARILQEVFLSRVYVKDLRLPKRPTIVDIGGYIGDFSLFAVKHLGARQVIVYEPSRKNYAVLRRNVESNNYGDVIVASNMAVSDSSEVLLNIDVPDREQANVSVFGSDRAAAARIPSITLADLIVRHSLDDVDLLKLDCEGAEYPILLSTPIEVFERIHNVVFEYHEIDGLENKLEAVEQKLRAAGYSVKEAGIGCIMRATRL
jgi:FkbM family methyltransferase